MLKANQEKQFWSNVVTAGEYAIDIVTTFSGVGNVLKFRHLNKLRLLGEVSQTITYVKLAVGVSEITTGSLNLALKLSDLKDTPFGKELSNYLFIIELLSLGGEIAAALKGALAKSADDLLKHEDALRKSAKNADEVKQVDELIEHLREVAEIDYLARWDDLSASRKGYLGGQTLRRKEIKFWIDEVKKISKGKSNLIVLPKGHQKLKGNVAGFSSFDGNIYVQQEVTEYEIFHEFKHLEEFIKIGKEKYLFGHKDLGYSLEQNLIRTYKREKYVFDEVMKININLIKYNYKMQKIILILILKNV